MHGDSKQLYIRISLITSVKENLSTKVCLSPDTHIPASSHAPFKLSKPHKIGLLITCAKTYQIWYSVTEAIQTDTICLFICWENPVATGCHVIAKIWPVKFYIALTTVFKTYLCLPCLNKSTSDWAVMYSTALLQVIIPFAGRGVYKVRVLQGLYDHPMVDGVRLGHGIVCCGVC